MNTAILNDADLDFVSGGAVASTEIVIVDSWGKFTIGFAFSKPGWGATTWASFVPPRGGKPK